MAKSKAKANAATLDQVREEINLMDFGRQKMKRYGMATLKGRAIPSLADGMKPVQRRILWSMHNLGLRPNAIAKKTQLTLGEVMGKYHPHGDAPISSAIETMVNCAEPFIDGNETNWGTISKPSAASRYTEAKLTEYAFNTFFDKDYIPTIEFQANYDDSLQEPISLPAKTCALLVNGTSGIAVGATCNIPAFTLETVNALIVKALSRKTKLTPKEVMETLVFHFPYGGKFNKTPDNRKAFENVVKNGSGTIEIIPEFSIPKDGKSIIVTGIPVSLRSGKAEIKIATHPDVQTLVDETTIENGMRYVINMKKGIKADKDKALQILKPIITKQAYRIAYLMDTYKEVDGEEIVETEFTESSLIDLLYSWIEYREELEEEKIEYQIEVLLKSIDRLKLYKLAHDKRDILDKCRDQNDPKAFLMKKLKVNDEDANFLLNLTVRQLTKIYSRDVLAEIKDAENEIKSLKKDLKNVKPLIVKSLKA